MGESLHCLVFDYINNIVALSYSTKHLLILNDNCHSLDQFPSLFSSSCKMCTLSRVFYNGASSEKSRHSEESWSIRSFTYIKNKSGPRTDPCDIPDDTQQRDDSDPSTFTTDIYFAKKILIKETNLALMPKLATLCRSFFMANSVEGFRKVKNYICDWARLTIIC